MFKFQVLDLPEYNIQLHFEEIGYYRALLYNLRNKYYTVVSEDTTVNIVFEDYTEISIGYIDDDWDRIYIDLKYGDNRIYYICIEDQFLIDSILESYSFIDGHYTII